MPSYREILEQQLHGAAAGSGLPAAFCNSPIGRKCTLCYASSVSYETELHAKQEALRLFWKQHFDDAILHPLVASPAGRRYRSISKRKLALHGRRVVIGLIDPHETKTGGILPVTACAIEPGSHQEVYLRVAKEASSPALQPLFEELRYVIVRGDESNTMVILSLTDSSPAIVKSANALSKILTAEPSTVRAVFAHRDESDGRYYLGSGDPAGRIPVRKLYGIQGLKHLVEGKRFFYPPTVFTQVNHHVLEAFVPVVRNLLEPDRQQTLLDLYCGYGLFGLRFAESYRAVLGADISPDAIKTANENALHQHARHTRFVRSTLDEESVHALLQRCPLPFSVILDPPRGGTAEGIIPLLASSTPRRVVHLFCSIERMPDELKQWERHGYGIHAAVPVDMFPGTAAIEFVVGLRQR
jgi:tRNA/tmRNA/rRNA uracil-C5-methylase (TrmA/RlmC/RlmD family)